MDRPFLLEVQCLFERLKEGTILCPNDIDILDRSFAAPSSSEIANAQNSIFSLLAIHSIQHFFESFSAIQAYARHNYTLLYVHNVLTKRIKGEWATFDLSLKASLREYVIHGMQRCLMEGDPQGLLQSYNEALVELLRLEWKELLGVFVESLESDELDAVPAKVLNNLTILKMLLSEGFGGSEGLVSSAETQQFKDTLEHYMRNILKHLCLCLHDEGCQRFLRITRCLETLCHCVEYIPAFELFNCNLIELLVGLIGAQEYKGKLTLCFEEIFRFEDRGTTGSSHSKIAKKLLLILEQYLERFERQQNDLHSQDKQCDSTEDSLYSRKTRRRRLEPADMHTDLINLLYEFLMRYVPAMDRSKNEGDLDIEFEGSIKLYFSHDLYEAFRLIYWRLAAFMNSALEKFSPFMQEASEEWQEQSRKVMICLRHLITLQGKLKLSAKEELHSSLMQNAIFNFTTLPLEFHPYYLHFGLLFNGCDKAEQPLPFSADFEEEYKELIRQILKLKDVTFIFFNAIEHRVSEVITTYYRKWKEGDLPEESLPQLINTVNRACWSAVYAYNIDPQATLTHNFTKMQREIIKAANYGASKAGQRSGRRQELARCFLINGKYVTQVYMGHLTVQEGLLLSFTNQHFNDTFLEYSFIVLSKILHYKTLDPQLEIEDIFNIIERLHVLEKVDPLNQNLIPVYPAIIRLAATICELVIKNKLDERKFPLRDLLHKLVGFQLQTLHAFSITNVTYDQPELQMTVLLFRKLTSISSFLRTAFTSPQAINALSSFFIWTRQALFNTVTQFQFKSTCFSQFLMAIDRESFDIAHILSFRKHYLELLKEHVSISTVILSLQTSHHKKSKDIEKVSKILIAEEAMRTDFIGQKQFKTKEYLSFALEVYRLLVTIGFKDHLEIINHSIFTAMISLDGWQEDTDVILEKYRFWAEITKTYLLILGKKSREMMVHLLQEFQLSQVSQQELILKVFQNLAETLSEACLRHNHPLLEEFFDIFLATFQKLFSQPCRKEPVFNEMAMVMLRYVEMAASIAPFEPRSRKDNLDVLYILLQEHIQRHSRLQFTTENCQRLHRLFQVRESGRWLVEIKDYVVYLKELNRVQTSMTT